MTNTLMAEVQVLNYKLNRIREHVERRLSTVEGEVSSELQYILSMISAYETVPAGWHLPKPFVKEVNNNDEKK